MNRLKLYIYGRHFMEVSNIWKEYVDLYIVIK